MESFEAKLIAAVKRKREIEGLSIRALSNVVGVSFSSLARIERGDGVPDNNSKVRLLEWLGPDAEAAGLAFDRVAAVHFRATKNVSSTTVRMLLRAADAIKEHGRASLTAAPRGDDGPRPENGEGPEQPVQRAKEELEALAQGFRGDLGLREDEPLDSLRLRVEGVEVLGLGQAHCVERSVTRYLGGPAAYEWSAMSVPIDDHQKAWVVLLNDKHTVQRQRVTLLEEFWHVILEHKLTKVAKIADAFGRTYDTAEEHDAYYLASATLLPRAAIQAAVQAGATSTQIAERFGTSPELVDYRIKRLGLWHSQVSKRRVELK